MRIGQLAAATGVSAKTLRYYESEGLVAPSDREPNGYRLYGEEAVARVGFIRRAQASGLSLGQIDRILAVRDGGHAPCRHAATLVEQRLAEVDGRLRELQQTRMALNALRDRLSSMDPAACEPAAVCSAMDP